MSTTHSSLVCQILLVMKGKLVLKKLCSPARAREREGEREKEREKERERERERENGLTTIHSSGEHARFAGVALTSSVRLRERAHRERKRETERERERKRSYHHSFEPLLVPKTILKKLTVIFRNFFSNGTRCSSIALRMKRRILDGSVCMSLDQHTKS